METTPDCLSLSKFLEFWLHNNYAVKTPAGHFPTSDQLKQLAIGHSKSTDDFPPHYPTQLLVHLLQLLVPLF